MNEVESCENDVKYYSCTNPDCDWTGSNPETCGNGFMLICPECWAEVVDVAKIGGSED